MIFLKPTSRTCRKVGDLENLWEPLLGHLFGVVFHGAAAESPGSTSSPFSTSGTLSPARGPPGSRSTISWVSGREWRGCCNRKFSNQTSCDKQYGNIRWASCTWDAHQTSMRFQRVQQRTKWNASLLRSFRWCKPSTFVPTFRDGLLTSRKGGTSQK